MSQVSEDDIKSILKMAVKACNDEKNIADDSIPRSEVIHLARICAHVYGNGPELSGGWVVSKREIPEFQRVIDSYVSELYERNGTYVLAFAGTADMDDAIDDVLQLIGRSQQYNAAAKNARVLAKALGKENLSFAGHSLGGGLATAAALATGARAVTFNPAWLTAATIKENGLHEKAEIVNYVVMGEALDVAQRCGKSFKDAKWNLPDVRIESHGKFSFLQSPVALVPPKGPIKAHKMCVVIETLETPPVDVVKAIVGNAVSSLLKQGSSGSRNTDSDTSAAKSLVGLASKALMGGLRKKLGGGQGGAAGGGGGGNTSSGQ